ncbi:MAG TPA: DUF3781 domain-containing protein, partial [Proteiniclasticum sp.]|nr:DUF3781 domain-containing protein [Proteiniclasticum sp.]
MKNLTANLNNLHTTDLGALRISRNVNIPIEDVVSWCKEFVKEADIIIGQGKNWYVYGKGIVITINAQSHTIITAHLINAKIRVMKTSDYVCLREFLYQSIFIPEGVKPPSRSIINDPQIIVYIKNFGAQPGDYGVVAEQSGQVVGAAWTRIISAY